MNRYNPLRLLKAINAKSNLLKAKMSLRRSFKTPSFYDWWEDGLFSFRNRKALSEEYFITKDGGFKKNSNYAVVLHLYYIENWDDIFLKKLQILSQNLEFDLYVTLPEHNSGYITAIRKQFKQANFLIVPNHGRDVLPFLKTAIILNEMGYQKVLKIHSKKSTHRDAEGNAAESGNDWLESTMNALIPDDKKALASLTRVLKDPSTGMVGPAKYFYPVRMYLGHNLTLIRRTMDNIDSNFLSDNASQNIDNFNFFGGTMFWVDLPSIKEVLPISKNNFQNEKGQTDGTLAHALERVFCILPQLKNKTIYGSSDNKIKALTKVDAIYPEWYFHDISQNKPRISIIVPVYGDWPSLSKNISSLIKFFRDSEEVLVHYVNDCGPEADILEAKIIDKINPITNFFYHRNEKNLGFVKSCNNAVENLVSKSNDVLLLNSDTKVTRNFALEMKKVLYSEKDIAAVTARSNNATIWSVPMTARLANHRTISYFLYRIMSNSLPTKYITPTIHGFCVLIRREVINRYGLFDEVYGRGYGEENDFAMRLRENGWKCAVANKAFVFHYESRSFGNDERIKQIENNEKILLKRYPNYRILVQEYWDSIKEPLK